MGQGESGCRQNGGVVVVAVVTAAVVTAVAVDVLLNDVVDAKR